jgi:acyl-CoA synthetase (AMP-forming)/AMP-acid ligase II
VFAEEVDQVVRTHPAVRDAACVGVPHARFGQAICALVELTAGASLDLTELTTFVHERLADYKAPRHLVVVDEVPRTASGKVDHPTCRRVALEGAVGSASPSR